MVPFYWRPNGDRCSGCGNPRPNNEAPDEIFRPTLDVQWHCESVRLEPKLRHQNTVNYVNDSVLRFQIGLLDGRHANLDSIPLLLDV